MPVRARTPHAQRRKADFRRLQVADHAVLVLPSATGPVRAAARIADSERHQRRSVVEIDADPIPSARLGGQVIARPFVVEPRGAAHLLRTACHRNGAADGQMRPAVIVACLLRARPLAARAAASLQQWRRLCDEREVEVEVAGGYSRLVRIPIQPQRPVADVHVGRGGCRFGQSQSCARGPLVVLQSRGARVGDRRVREQQLPRREAAGSALRNAGAVAKERDLDA